MDWVLASKDQLLNQDYIADKEIAICFQDFREFHYCSSFYSLVLLLLKSSLVIIS